jgi:uncharacterized cupredoxin-like copper-binding protein
MVSRAPILLASLIAWGPAAAQNLSWAEERTVTVQLSNFRYSPSAIDLQVHKPHRLRLVNRSSSAHSFASKAFFASSTIRADDHPKVNQGRVEVPAGQTVEVEVIPRRTGEYRLHCTHPLHSAFGMTGTITVE